MKSISIVKNLSFCALVSLSLSTGLAQADDGSCLFGSKPQAAAPRMIDGEAGMPMMSSMEARMNQQLDRIEQGLRNGQISPAQAGRMMREQWEALQFQRGFLAGSRSAGNGRVSGGGESCALKQDAREIAAKLGPLVGNLAEQGMRTATTVMRALAREAEKLTREDAPLDERF